MTQAMSHNCIYFMKHFRFFLLIVVRYHPQGHVCIKKETVANWRIYLLPMIFTGASDLIRE